MQEANVSVPLLPPDQSAPRSGVPIGRLRRLLNGIVRKHRPDGSIKVEKRTGFGTLSRNVAEVDNPASTSSSGLPGTTLLGTLGNELVQIANSVPHVYAPAGPRYEQFDGLVMTETANRRIVHAGTRSITIPDRARLGNVECTVWEEGGATWAKFMDLSTDTPIREPFQVQAQGRIKVAADSARFWICAEDSGTNVLVYAYSTAGALQDDATLTVLPVAGEPWDITAVSTGGIVIAHNAAIGVDYVRLDFATFSAGAIVITGPVFNNMVPATYGVSWLRNDLDPTRLYLATTSQFDYVSPGPTLSKGVYVARMSLAGAHQALYVLADGMTQDQVKQITGLTGYVSDQVSPGTFVYVSWTTFERAGGLKGRAMNSTVTTRRGEATPSAAVPIGVQRSVSLAGRAFKLGTRYVLPCYYASVSGEGAVDTLAVPVAQATYFLVDILTQTIVGELEYGTAAFDWPWSGWDPAATFSASAHWLPSSFVDADGIVHLTLGYAADIQTVQTRPEDVQNVNTATPTAAILDARLGGRGIGVEFSDALLLPGPRAVAFSRDAFLHAGIELAPEAPTVQPVDASSPDGVMEEGEEHRYQLVYKVLDTKGNVTRSITGPVTAPTTVTAGNNALQLTIPTLRMTSHERVLIEIYSDVWDTANNTAGNQLRKITVDEATEGDERVPVYNDPTVDTITFVDRVRNSARAIGAAVYTDDGTLDYYPCPAFSTGCVFADRVFVGGYDNRVYYSFSKVPGQGIAFNQERFFVTLPTSQRVTALVPLDNRLFIFCESKIFYVDGAGFLSADGLSGANPTPIELTFANGCTGRAVAITAGVVYASSAGGWWLLTRGLENVYLGSNVEDEAEGATTLDIAIDENQRIGILTGANLIVYDQVVGVWSVWSLPETGVALTTWRGKFVVADNEATQNTWEQGATYADATAPIQTRIDLQDISLADIHGFQVIWEPTLLGEWKGAHTLNVELTYDGSDTVDETFARTFSTLLKPFRFALGQPKNAECSSIGMSIYDTFPGDTPSQGFTLESIGLYVGVERGAKYQATRIAPTG